ncbi:Putative TonB-dependent receptor protein [Bradyrhizobium sp. ORS 285]|uniref:TonB-dependent receptor family protein n=1 Tax=Bradyrhizobium sp. ORS 285 TaxID=115808 RepID=UPI0002407ED5|nr:TonB-dependent receptor [Bradyrhizobium sp. ORS 285]CCD87982.1 putative TonB-dependent receptor protein [Bradyrhizobium sp. ORS 285]SMX57233.1 Putative TonB-dependent receptor protein [Bradyrhizobium sp. ORS 285]
MSRSVTALCAATCLVTLSSPCFSQAREPSNLPTVTVDPARPSASRPARPANNDQPARRARAPRSAAAPQTATAAPAGPAPSRTAPNTQTATQRIQQIAGAVAVVPDTAFKNGSAQTIKDVLDYVPGVFAQPKWGDDTRLSIRGSGLSRNFHLRGTQLTLDGIPINTADGYGDFQEIDPTAYRYVEVYKGANALRYGANSLGGAVNFVTPTGRDASAFESRLDGGAFGFLRGQASTGGVTGAADYFVTGSASRVDGYRDHSWGQSERGSANLGYQVSPDFETRFYLNANTVRQRIPGEVSKTSALNSPETAAANNVLNDWQRNIDTVRVANKSTLHLDNIDIEFGVFAVDRHLMHPIFQWLDYRYHDYGGFVRAVDDREIGDHRNRFTVGLNIQNGTIDADQFVNIGVNKGAQTFAAVQRPENYTLYAENAWYVTPAVSLIAGAQYLHAVREQRVDLTTDPTKKSGSSVFDLFSPKLGLLWDVDPGWQVFANISRSGEAPSFGEGNGAVIPFYDIKAQTATTYEIGTRGRRPDVTWDFALYHADIRNELQCFYSSFGNCNVTNADKTMHQGVEAGLGLSLLKGLAVKSDAPDRVWLNLAYTYNDFRYDNDATWGNNRLPGAPPHFLRAELLYKHPAGFAVGPNVEWVPQSYFVDSANTLSTESYLLWGLKATYDDGKNFSAYLEGRNLANKAYIATTSIIDRATPTSTLFNPGNGRGVYAGLRYKL